MSRRNFHVGVDWGTSASKLVIRELGIQGNSDGEAYPVLFGGGSPRYPSTVVLEGNRLWFGEEAEARRPWASKVWDSLKAKAGAGGDWDQLAVSGLLLQDLVTLSLAHLMAVARDRIHALAPPSLYESRIGATIGVPTKELQKWNQRYLDCAIASICLALQRGFNPQGRSIQEVCSELSRARPIVERHRTRAQAEWDVFLRPEPSAAILWLFRLPQVGDGPYFLVDVGAATVHATFFRIHGVHDPDGRWIEKGGVALYGTETALCGMDRIGYRLWELNRVQSYVQARGMEEKFMSDPDIYRSLEVQLKAMREVWRNADHEASYLKMCPMYVQHLLWIVVGGGSRVKQIRAQFDAPPEYLGRVVKVSRPLRGHVRPDDLMQIPSDLSDWRQPYAKDSEFLMVAYGCSLPRGSVPEMSLPSDQERIVITRPKRHTPAFDELGYG